MYIQQNWPVSMPRVRALGDGVHELRSSHDGVEYRVAFVVREKEILVLHGFEKKRQQTDQNDLKLIEKRKKLV